MFKLLEIAKLQQKHMTEQKKAIASNIANVDRPNYRGRHVQELKSSDFKNMVKSAGSDSRLNLTHARHVQAPKAPGGGFKMKYDQVSSDVSSSGNTVSVHDEMMRAADLNAQSKMTHRFMKSFLNLFKVAAR